MKHLLLFAAASCALVACGEDKPAPVVHEVRVVNHYHTVDRPSPSTSSDNPADFEPVERPATYSR